MKLFFYRLDSVAGTSGKGLVLWLERSVFVFLVLMTVSAPHSIAATQTAWLTGMFLWLIAVAIRWKRGTGGPSNRGIRLLSIALWAFFAWSVVTSFTSYAPDISIDKLRGVSVFLIFFFVFYNARNLHVVHFLAFALIASCMVNVLWMPVQRLIGRGVEIHGLMPGGAIAKTGLMEGDALLEANGRKVHSPEDLIAVVEQNEATKVKFYRPDFEWAVEVKRADLLPGSTAMERLGFSSWKKSRNWRSSGFYGHYTTYAEVLQLIASLVFGLLVAAFSKRRGEEEKRSGGADVSLSPHLPVSPSSRLSFSSSPLLLLFCLAAMTIALLLTVTRASQLAFIISAAVIVMVGLGRKWIWRAALIGLPLVLIGLFFLQQSRQVGFFDPKDDSTKYRLTVWSEGFELWTNSPRNFVFGVGMDSIKRYAPEWRLFDNGRWPMGHFHSTPVQLLVERGLPALILWLVILGVYMRMLWSGLKKESEKGRKGEGEIVVPLSHALTFSPSWTNRGILLGCAGGTIGFFASSLVHYNLGDQEVAMVFFLLMGLAVRVVTFHPETSPAPQET